MTSTPVTIQTNNNDSSSPATMTKSLMRAAIAKLETRIRNNTDDETTVVPSLFAPFVPSDTAKPFTLQSVQQRHSRRKRPSSKRQVRRTQSHKRSLSQQLQEIIGRLNPIEPNSASVIDTASSDYGALVREAKSQLRHLREAQQRQLSESDVNILTQDEIRAVLETDSVRTSRHGAVGGEQRMDARIIPSLFEQDAMPDRLRLKEVRLNAAIKIQSLVRRYNARCRYQTHRRMQHIQQRLEDIPNQTRIDLEQIRQCSERQKHDLWAKMQHSLCDMKRLPPSNHAVVIACLRKNNAHLRKLQGELRQGIAELQHQNSELMREHDIIQDYFVQVEEITVNLRKENEVLQKTEKKFRTEVRRRYREQKRQQERHLVAEQKQNAMYKVCIGRIVRHVTRHEAAINRQRARNGSQIVFELDDLAIVTTAQKATPQPAKQLRSCDDVSCSGDNDCSPCTSCSTSIEYVSDSN